MVKLLQYSFIVLLIYSCEPTGSSIGPCVHTYEEPVLTIQSVSSAETGNKISTLEIFNVKIDNVSGNPASLIDEVSENISVEDSILICTIPCGFGTMEGTYEFAVKADGFKDSIIYKSAQYNKLEGGCPSSSSDGTKISFSLIPE
jgi:hypothetical protein